MFGRKKLMDQIRDLEEIWLNDYRIIDEMACEIQILKLEINEMKLNKDKKMIKKLSEIIDNKGFPGEVFDVFLNNHLDLNMKAGKVSTLLGMEFFIFEARIMYSDKDLNQGMLYTVIRIATKEMIKETEGI